MGCTGGSDSGSPRIPASLSAAARPDLRPALPASQPTQLAGCPVCCFGPALPATEFRVAPVLLSFRRCRLTGPGLPRERLFGIADDSFSGSPRSPNLPAPAGRSSSGLPEAHLPVLPVARSPGLPGSLSAGLAFGGTFGLLRLFRSAGGADRPFPSCPEAGVCGAGLGPRFRVAPVRLPFRLRRCLCELPRLGTAVGSMMNPVCPRTLHPRLAPWMNLRVQPVRFFCLALEALSGFSRPCGCGLHRNCTVLSPDPA